MQLNHDLAPEAVKEDRGLRESIAARGLWKGLRKAPMFLASLLLFILGIELLKGGAQGVAPLIGNYLAVDNPANALGFGWLLAYLVMSGSPVAAATLAFFDAGALDRLQALAMITGSRGVVRTRV
jgi:Na+/phosphate symporter